MGLKELQKSLDLHTQEESQRKVNKIAHKHWEYVLQEEASVKLLLDAVKEEGGIVTEKELGQLRDLYQSETVMSNGNTSASSDIWFRMRFLESWREKKSIRL